MGYYTLNVDTHRNIFSCMYYLSHPTDHSSLIHIPVCSNVHLAYDNDYFMLVPEDSIVDKIWEAYVGNGSTGRNKKQSSIKKVRHPTSILLNLADNIF